MLENQKCSLREVLEKLQVFKYRGNHELDDSVLAVNYRLCKL